MPAICLAVAICCVEFYSVHGDKTIPCTVQVGQHFARPVAGTNYFLCIGEFL